MKSMCRVLQESNESVLPFWQIVRPLVMWEGCLAALLTG